MAEIGSILGTTGSMGVSLKRETPPWTSMEVEIEFKGNWLHCTEAYDKWWEKQVYSISNLVFSPGSLWSCHPLYEQLHSIHACLGREPAQR